MRPSPLRPWLALPLATALLAPLAGQAALKAPLPAAANGGEKAAPLSGLLEQARSRTRSTARVNLPAETTALFQGIESLEPAGSNRVPNYVRAMASVPGAVKPMARLVKTVLTRGTVQPEIKLAMGLRIAQQDRSPYVATHLHRLLATTADGTRLAQAVSGSGRAVLSPQEEAALSFAAALGKGPRELTDAEYRKARTWYDDAQIVELTGLVSFYSFFNRFCEGLNLPVESWALETQPAPLPAWEARRERIALVSDREVELFRQTAERMAAAPKPEPGKPATSGGGLGIGIANSQRAMVQAPELSDSWFGFMGAARESSLVNRNDKLQVSFAVSMVNGCRYCTVHQVVGLRRLGVDPVKLQSMQKSDQALTPRERAAVLFARKLTRTPSSVTDADYRTLAAEFTEQGALEVLLQTCCFNFMNRFTDGLKLPSEDEAIHIYQEVYGPGSYAGYGGKPSASAR